LKVTLALDAMGGDRGPVEIVPAALKSLEKFPELHLILVGIQDQLDRVIAGNRATVGVRLSVHNATEVVEMHELPSQALRNKKDSSMRVAIELVKDGVADACVSAGNTGALMVLARYVLKMLPGIDRPAICSIMPGIAGNTHLLDLGANVDSSADQLFQFAVMGAELTSAVYNIPSPSVALLNVGAEEIKGNDRVKQAAALLAGSHLNYVGFVEGNDIYTGKADVIVCDGFVGNIALKASEGVAELMMRTVKQQFQKNTYGRFAALISLPVLKAIRQQLDPRHYNGASLLGLRGIVIKSHGGADRIAFSCAIEEAMLEVQKNVPQRISSQLHKLFPEG
jgi:fatty acid/phospholipid synthesis protein PlsX